MLDTRVRSLLRKMNIKTVEELLGLDEVEIRGMQNCGPKTAAKVLELQAKYGKVVALPNRAAARNNVLAESRSYFDRLIEVALAANELIAGAKKDEHSRYYFCVTTKRFNTLKKAVEMLKIDT